IGMNGAGGEGGARGASEPPGDADSAGVGGGAGEPPPLPAAGRGGVAGQGAEPARGAGRRGAGGEQAAGAGGPAGGGAEGGGGGGSAALRDQQQSGCSCSTPRGSRGNVGFVVLGCLLGVVLSRARKQRRPASHEINTPGFRRAWSQGS